MLSIDDLNTALHYDPKTGHLSWKRDGSTADTILHRAGYRRLFLGGEQIEAHRAAFAIHHGVWPEMVDHINGDRGDNRIVNLRGCTNQQNQQNAKRSKANTSGITGVRMDKRTGKWVAGIKHNRKEIHLGSYGTSQEAVAARKAAEKVLGFMPGHGENRTSTERAPVNSPVKRPHDSANFWGCERPR